MINEYMTSEHRHCDAFFAMAEDSAVNGDMQQARVSFLQFQQQMELHFSKEENVLFPAFESTTGNTSGPTQMMRIEHTQMRSMFEEMNQALESNNNDEYLGLCETLLILMQQHNMKEEQILYPMADNHLAQNSDQLLNQMKAM